jgi:hypothetical protein
MFLPLLILANWVKEKHSSTFSITTHSSPILKEKLVIHIIIFALA